MLVCSVMCFACLMACATSSFMSVHFPAKKVSVFVYLSVCVFVMGRYLHKYWTVNSTPPTYLSSQTVQRAYRFFWEASDLFVLEKKNVLFVTLGHIFFLYLSFLSFFYTQNSLPHKRITPLLLSSCLHRALYLSRCKYFRHCTRHGSHFNLHPSLLFVFSTQTNSFRRRTKNKQTRERSQTCSGEMF